MLLFFKLTSLLEANFSHAVTHNSIASVLISSAMSECWNLKDVETWPAELENVVFYRCNVRALIIGNATQLFIQNWVHLSNQRSNGRQFVLAWALNKIEGHLTFK